MASTDWLSDNVGTVLTVGGSIAVAVITVLGAAWAKNHTPKQPVPIQDVWGENRTLRNELREVRDAFDALFDWAERVIRLWGSSISIPLFTRSERDIITKVRRLPSENDDDNPTT